MPDPTSIRTPRRRRIFLSTLRETAIVAEACRKAGAARGSFYNWRYADPDFARAWDLALEEGMATLEDEAIRRARDGVEVPVFHGGRQVATTRKYSDRLLVFLLKAHRPRRYCERARAAAIAATAGGSGRHGGFTRNRDAPGGWMRLPVPAPPDAGPDIRLPDGRRIAELSDAELDKAWRELAGRPPPPPPRP